MIELIPPSRVVVMPYHLTRIAVVLACLLNASAADARAGKITDMTLKFHTNDDNREGGIVEVTLWQDDRLIAKYEDTERSWGDNTEIRISAENSLKDRVFTSGSPIEARIKLKEGREVNISWRFNVEVDAFDDQGKKLVFKREGMKLDTTGKGPNRESEASIGKVTP